MSLPVPAAMAPEADAASDPALARRLRFLRAFSMAFFLAAFLLAFAPWVLVFPAAGPWASDAYTLAPYAAGLLVFAAYGILQVPSRDHKHPRTALVLFWAGVGALALHGSQSLLDDPRFTAFGRPLLALAASYALRVRAVLLDPARPTRFLIDLTFGYLATLVVLFLITHLGWIRT